MGAEKDSRRGVRRAVGLAALAGVLLGCGVDDTPSGPAGVAASHEAVQIVRDCAVSRQAFGALVNVAQDVTYATIGGDSLRLDVAWPKTGGPHPLVVIFHAGGWTEGERGTHWNDAGILADLGYAAATVDYRLADGKTRLFPAPVSDARCAIRWLRSHRAAYNIDPARVAAMGFSAGGHLATMVALADGVASLDDRCPVTTEPSRVSAAISYDGPQDLRDIWGLGFWGHGAISELFGAEPEKVSPAALALASPIAHVDASDPPVLLVHRTGDAVVPIAQSRALARALQQAGGQATLLELPGTDHLYGPFGTGDTKPASCTALAFLQQVLRPSPPAPAGR